VICDGIEYGKGGDGGWFNKFNTQSGTGANGSANGIVIVKYSVLRHYVKVSNNEMLDCT
jgi:hypothetical protein